MIPMSSKSHYPHGVEAVKLYTRTSLYVAIIAPGKFYDRSRKFNSLDVDPDHQYKYTARKAPKSLDFVSKVAKGYI